MASTLDETGTGAAATDAPADRALDAAPLTERGRQKADRRAAILRAAATLFAERGYAGVTIEDLGAAVGVSGPAVYRHFPGKDAMLAAILQGASRSLLDGAERVLESTDEPGGALPRPGPG